MPRDNDRMVVILDKLEQDGFGPIEETANVIGRVKSHQYGRVQKPPVNLVPYTLFVLLFARFILFV